LNSINFSSIRKINLPCDGTCDKCPLSKMSSMESLKTDEIRFSTVTERLTPRILCTLNFLVGLFICYSLFLSCFFFQLTKRVARKDARRVECLVRLISREIVGPVGVTESVRSIRFPRFSRPDRYDSGPKPLRILER